jgi:hypothetical protein
MFLPTLFFTLYVYAVHEVTQVILHNHLMEGVRCKQKLARHNHFLRVKGKQKRLQLPPSR